MTKSYDLKLGVFITYIKLKNVKGQKRYLSEKFRNLNKNEVDT